MQKYIEQLQAPLPAGMLAAAETTRTEWTSSASNNNPDRFIFRFEILKAASKTIFELRWSA